MLNFGVETPEWPADINLPKLAQAGYDMVDFWPFLSLLFPALLDKFPHP